jgi:cytochrome c biogenesis protein CcmG, thiol:disulfide interchange protein DsbE
VTVLLIDIQEPHSTVEAAVKERGYTLPVLLDGDGSVTQAYGVHATPTVYLADSHGFLKAQAVGPRDWDSPAGLRILKSLNKR